MSSPSSSSAAAAGVFLSHARPVLQRSPAATSVAGGGSYTAVFVVLGVIAALLVLSCLVGQVCTKKHLRPRPRRDRVAYYDDDLEFGAAKMEAAAPSAVTTTAVVVETPPAAAASASASVETRPAVA